MPKAKRIQKQPFGRLGRWLFVILFIELLVIWARAGIAIYYLSGTTIPVHYGLNGAPNGYGNSGVFYILAVAFSIAPVLIMLISYYRFKLINDYPYLINMPAFYASIMKVSESRKGYWINRYFELDTGAGSGSRAGLLRCWFS